MGWGIERYSGGKWHKLTTEYQRESEARIALRNLTAGKYRVRSTEMTKKRSSDKAWVLMRLNEQMWPEVLGTFKTKDVAEQFIMNETAIRDERITKVISGNEMVGKLQWQYFTEENASENSYVIQEATEWL